uniref:Glycosyl transferase family protein n=1 Tax=uncultured organism MedDCM-OCT-S12-C71 TaxID=743666 RepID=D6PLL9_9ZZZZ|nr:glycosyl transferase family protein [uncultured organism MedDCM-OCT-S12-C71]
MTNIDAPTVTIGITAFNCEDTLRRAVASALEQDYQYTDILIVDDCSTDRTHTIAIELAASHKGIRVIRAQQNGGVAASRNLIINNTDSDFIVFFDDDDVSVSNRVTAQIKSILACEQDDHTKLVICHTARLVEYLTGHIRYEPSLAQTVGSKGVHGPLAEAILCGTNNKDHQGACATCSQMARTTTYQQVGGFDENLRRSEDTEFSIRAAELDATFVGLAVPLVQQYMTKGDDKSLELELEQWRYIFRKHQSIVERRIAYSFAVRWLKLKHLWLGQNYITFAFNLAFMFATSPIQTAKKIFLSLPNISLNSAMSNFHNNHKRR